MWSLYWETLQHKRYKRVVFPPTTRKATGDWPDCVWFWATGYSTSLLTMPPSVLSETQHIHQVKMYSWA